MRSWPRSWRPSRRGPSSSRARCLDRVVTCLAAARGAGTIVALDGEAGRTRRCRGARCSISAGASIPQSERTRFARTRERCRRTRRRWDTRSGPTGPWPGASCRTEKWSAACNGCGMRSRIARGDVAYLTGDVPSLATSVALLAFTADGYTQVVIGAKENELEEIAMTRPHKIIAPGRDGPADARSRRRRRAPRRASGEVAGTSAIPPRRPARRRATARPRPPRFGGEGALAEHGPALALPMRARARKFVTLEIDDSLVLGTTRESGREPPLDHRIQSGKRGSLWAQCSIPW